MSPVQIPEIPEDSEGPLGPRHPSEEAVMRWLTKTGHLHPELRWVVEAHADLAELMRAQIPSDPELTLGLHKLKEAKDCFVRAAVAAGFGRAVNKDLAPLAE